MLEREHTGPPGCLLYTETGSDRNDNQAVAGAAHDHIFNVVRKGAGPAQLSIPEAFAGWLHHQRGHCDRNGLDI